MPPVSEQFYTREAEDHQGDNVMRTLAAFVCGVLFGVFVHAGSAQERSSIALNHVALAVENFQEASRFYSEVMGFPVAFTLREPDGQPALTYFQISRNTFIEVMPASATRPPGFVHVGLEVSNLDATVKILRQRGLSVRDPNVSARTKSRIAVATTPQAAGVELLEFGPDSLQRKVIDAWR
jgi:catechol 2,3-dioxygenase-like lactoylglutathione lyase family enzyme